MFRVILVSELEKNWKKDVVAEFDLLSQQLPEIFFVIEEIARPSGLGV